MTMDEKHDDGLGGRSRDRREVNQANRWARPLRALLPREFEAAPLPEEVREAAALLRSLDSPRAVSRQIQRVDKLIRLLEDDEIGAIDAFLAKPTMAPRPIDPRVVALDGWCDRLIAEGDAALDAWMALHPDADRQRLRTLVRNAKAGAPDRRKALRAALTG